MANYSPNLPCPCGSGKKYKRCCGPYHKGALPANALLLMKSRYSAYATGKSSYIIQTTHPDNPDYSHDIKGWKASIDHFCSQSSFEGLTIIDWTEGDEESFVTFSARLSGETMVEKSRFVKLNHRWLYIDGEFLTNEL